MNNINSKEINLEKKLAEFIKKAFLVVFFVFVVFFFIVILFFSNVEKKQLHEKLMIKGIGIDYDNGEYKLSIQALDFKNSTSGKEPSIKNLEIKGQTIGESINKISKITGLKPLFSQNLIIVIGQEAANKGTNKFMDFFTRYYENRLNTKIRLSNTSAHEILKSTENEKLVTAQNLKSLIDDNLDIDVLEFEKNINDKICDPVLMVLDFQDDDENDDNDEKEEKGEKNKKNEKETKQSKKIICEKMAIFSNDKLIYILDKDETLAMQILRNKSNLGTIEIMPASKIDEIGTCTIKNVKTEIIPYLNKKRPNFEIKINILAEILEINKNKDNIKEIKKETKDRLTNRLTSIIKSTLKKVLNFKSDPFKFGKILRNFKPLFFKSLESKWKQFLPLIEYKIDLNVEVKEIGTGN